MRKRKNSSVSIMFVGALFMLSLTPLAQADSIDKKLEQCKQSFSVAHNKDSTQKVAVAAQLKHLKLMKEIIHELNVKNADKKMTNDELQQNVMVMSHLLEMLVTENLNKKENSWNLNY
ncbi:hypothetical protein MNBD_GAMMA08-1161 [hydrothermal vent metagenome]|uniref:Uncharacterized protein n=1 Tax=hydrothermal vent metagenome TaxID=652676 RepID=A0A3B0XQY7_9ZZZZ